MFWPMCWTYSKKEYLSTVNDAIDFISGKSRRIQKNLSKEMEETSKELN